VEKLHLRLFTNNVALELEAFEAGCHLCPINSIGYGGVHHSFVEQLEWMVPDDHDTFLARVEALPAQAEQYIALLRSGLERGIVASQDMLRKVVPQLEESKTSSLLIGMIEQVPEALSARAQAALTGYVAAIEAVKVFVMSEYAPQARATPGCKGMAQGEHIYNISLRYHTTTTMSAAEIHEVGLQEVARIEQRYQADVMAPLGFAGTFEEFVAQCKGDKTLHYDTEAQLLDGYQKLSDRIAEVLPGYFAEFPASKLEIVSKQSETAPCAFYLSGTPDGSRPGRFYVNVSHLDKKPKYEMTALALHEGIPGHHHQGSIAIENPNIPNFMRYIEDRRYEFAPARRQMYTAYLEGWALYCEALGEEMGFYTDPLDLFGRLSCEMMRAVRLVVDTGIHDQGWSVERAIEYMMTKTGMARAGVEAECYRYEAWPGQACAYKIGEVAIWRIRNIAETKLGQRFDLKQFHSIVLGSGPMPLETLEAAVDDWIQLTLA